MKSDDKVTDIRAAGVRSEERATYVTDEKLKIALQNVDEFSQLGNERIKALTLVGRRALDTIKGDRELVEALGHLLTEIADISISTMDAINARVEDVGCNHIGR